MRLTTTAARARGVARVSGVYYGTWLVGAAFIAQFVSVGSQNYVTGVFLKPMTAELGWNRAEFTLARTIGQFVMAFVGVFVGGYVDRHGGRRPMTLGIAILSVALFSLGFVHELWQWLLLNGLILTVGAALIGNLVVNITLSKWFVERRGRVVGTAAMGVSFAGIVLPWLMTSVVDAWGWRTGWRVLALGAAALIVPVSLVMRRAPEDHGLYPDGKTAAEMEAGRGGAAARDFANSFTRREAMRTRAFYLIVLSFGLFGINIGVMLLHTIPFLTDAGYSRATASVMITITSIPALVTKPVWGYFIDRADPNRLAAIGAVFNGVAMFMIVGSVHAGSLPMIYVSYFVLGCGWGGQIPLQEVVWATYFGRRYLGAVRSAALPLSLLITAAAPVLTSTYYDRAHNYDGAFLAIAVLSLFASGLMFTVRRPQLPARLREGMESV